jgi:hypothetical protein
VSSLVRRVLVDLMNNPGAEAVVHHIKQGCFFGQILFRENLTKANLYVQLIGNS